jgi:hypothetical protein
MNTEARCFATAVKSFREDFLANAWSHAAHDRDRDGTSPGPTVAPASATAGGRIIGKRTELEPNGPVREAIGRGVLACASARG